MYHSQKKGSTIMSSSGSKRKGFPNASQPSIITKTKNEAVDSDISVTVPLSEDGTSFMSGTSFSDSSAVREPSSLLSDNQVILPNTNETVLHIRKIEENEEMVASDAVDEQDTLSPRELEEDKQKENSLLEHIMKPSKSCFNQHQENSKQHRKPPSTPDDFANVEKDKDSTGCSDGNIRADDFTMKHLETFNRGTTVGSSDDEDNNYDELVPNEADYDYDPNISDDGLMMAQKEKYRSKVSKSSSFDSIMENLPGLDEDYKLSGYSSSDNEIDIDYDDIDAATTDDSANKKESIADKGSNEQPVDESQLKASESLSSNKKDDDSDDKIENGNFLTVTEGTERNGMDEDDFISMYPSTSGSSLVENVSSQDDNHEDIVVPPNCKLVTEVTISFGIQVKKTKIVPMDDSETGDDTKQKESTASFAGNSVASSKTESSTEVESLESTPKSKQELPQPPPRRAANRAVSMAARAGMIMNTKSRLRHLFTSTTFTRAWKVPFLGKQLLISTQRSTIYASILLLLMVAIITGTVVGVKNRTNTSGNDDKDNADSLNVISITLTDPPSSATATLQPSFAPFVPSTLEIVNSPTWTPTFGPTRFPTFVPTIVPTSVPTVPPTAAPSKLPSARPSLSPSLEPTMTPTTDAPSSVPTTSMAPTSFTEAPTFSAAPTLYPTAMPSSLPSLMPTTTPIFFENATVTYEISTELPLDDSFYTVLSNAIDLLAQSSSIVARRLETGKGATISLGSPSFSEIITEISCPSDFLRSPITGEIYPIAVNYSCLLMKSTIPLVIQASKKQNITALRTEFEFGLDRTIAEGRLQVALVSNMESVTVLSGLLLYLPPTGSPTWIPTSAPTSTSSSTPSNEPTHAPTRSPTQTPTSTPTITPTTTPTSGPIAKPTSTPTSTPSFVSVITNPIPAATAFPSAGPRSTPTSTPTARPSFLNVVTNPIPAATSAPTAAPRTAPFPEPTSLPTAAPSPEPGPEPTGVPVLDLTSRPSSAPSAKPTVVPSQGPSPGPTAERSSAPTQIPVLTFPQVPVRTFPPIPNFRPTPRPTGSPTTRIPTTPVPTVSPTLPPTPIPTTRLPTVSPSLPPTPLPTTLKPTTTPTSQPTIPPTPSPTSAPSASPTRSPAPTTAPTPAPTLPPTTKPTHIPTNAPSLAPTPFPTPSPSRRPSAQPTGQLYLCAPLTRYDETDEFCYRDVSSVWLPFDVACDEDKMGIVNTKQYQCLDCSYPTTCFDLYDVNREVYCYLDARGDDIYNVCTDVEQDVAPENSRSLASFPSSSSMPLWARKLIYEEDCEPRYYPKEDMEISCIAEDRHENDGTSGLRGTDANNAITIQIKRNKKILYSKSFKTK